LKSHAAAEIFFAEPDEPHAEPETAVLHTVASLRFADAEAAAIVVFWLRD